MIKGRVEVATLLVALSLASASAREHATVAGCPIDISRAFVSSAAVTATNHATGKLTKQRTNEARSLGLDALPVGAFT